MKPDYSARKYGLPTMPTKERLMSMVKVNPITNCWEWQGCKMLGYGHTIIGSRKDGTRHTIRAHRLAYFLWKGEIPNGYCVCHKCDNPSCINPEHLFIGTKKDNADDRDRKGRNSHTKLTKKIVKEIRCERAYKGTKYIELAQRYGISELSIIKAIKGKTWKCVDYYPQIPNLEGGERSKTDCPYGNINGYEGTTKKVGSYACHDCVNFVSVDLEKREVECNADTNR